MATSGERRRAREAVRRAMRSGRLVKPSACEGCGSERTWLYAHHPDCSEPLAVEWLCRNCDGLAQIDIDDTDPSQLLWGVSGTDVVDYYAPPWYEGGEDADYIEFLSGPTEFH